MQAEIIAIGSELLLGGRPETNSIFLTEALVPLGIEVRYKTVVGDRESDIEEAVRRAFERASLIITTGGLGQTEDDITKKVISKVTRRRLVLREEILQQIAKRYGGLKRSMPKQAERQALIPSQATVLENPVGIAPGFTLTQKESRFRGGQAYLVVLPGVPHEMERMFKDSVSKFLANITPASPAIHLKTVRSYGLPESRINELIKDLFLVNKAVHLGLAASPLGVDVRIQITGKKAEEAEALSLELVDLLQERLGDHIYGTGPTTMEAVVGGLLKEHGVTLAVAESCTGGLIGHRLTNIPGSSDYLDRVLVCYSNRAKIELLGVPARTLREHGAVSSPTVIAMAQGLLKSSGADLALAVTGIAGPAGGTKEKPVGLVYIGLASAGDSHCRFYRFMGAREIIKLNASQRAWDLNFRENVYRLFISLELPQAIKDAAGVVQMRLRETGADVGWSRPEGMHLTLKFLGELERQRVHQVETAMTEIGEGFQSLTITVEGLGGFPALNKPRVIWLGIEEPSGALIGLQKRVDRTLAGLGFPEEPRDFHPHLTLGRVRSDKNRDALSQALRTPVLLGEWSLDEMNLMRSMPGSGRSIYSKLWTVKAVKTNPQSM